MEWTVVCRIRWRWSFRLIDNRLAREDGRGFGQNNDAVVSCSLVCVRVLI